MLQKILSHTAKQRQQDSNRGLSTSRSDLSMRIRKSLLVLSAARLTPLLIGSLVFYALPATRTCKGHSVVQLNGYVLSTQCSTRNSIKVSLKKTNEYADMSQTWQWKPNHSTHISLICHTDHSPFCLVFSTTTSVQTPQTRHTMSKDA